MRGVEREAPDLGVAHDHGEQVVEVVRDAGGEAPGRFHALAVQELIFELVTTRGIHTGAGHAHGAACFVAKRAAPVLYPAQRAVLSEHAVLERDLTRGTFETLTDGTPHAFAIIGVHDREVALVRAVEARPGDAEDI